MFAFLTPLLSFLGGPIVNGLISAYKAKLEAGNTTDRIAADLAAKEIEGEVALRQDATRQNIAENGRWWTAAPRSIVQWSFAIFVAKCVVWDKVLNLGTTDGLQGDIAQWAGLVMAMWFGGRTIEKVARIIKR